LALDDGELVHCQPVVSVGIAEVDQADVIPSNASVVTAILDGYAVAQQLVKRTVVADERWRVVSEQFAQRFFSRVAWKRPIQPGNYIAHSAHQQYIGEELAFCSNVTRRDLGRACE
jgi:hypothetical protein